MKFMKLEVNALSIDATGIHKLEERDTAFVVQLAQMGTQTHDHNSSRAIFAS